MTRKIFVSALVSGALAGLFAAALQFIFVIPLLLEAELYETGARVHFADGRAESIAQAPAVGMDIQRHGLTVAFNLIAWIGFALILTAAMAAGARRGWPITSAQGAMFGLVAFCVIHLAPAAGLPPELPGTVAAEVNARYTWWLGTIIASVAAIGILVYRPGIAGAIAAGILLAMPHLIGAPHLENYFGIAPPELAAHFTTRSLAVNAATWAVAGSLAGWLWSRA